MNKKAVRSRGKTQVKVKKARGGGFSVGKRIFLLVVLLFMTSLTIIVSQNRQTLLQHADVTYSEITPQFHCLTLGPSNCKGVASSTVTTCPGLTVLTPLKLDKDYSSLGASISGTITYKNDCTVPYSVSSIFIGIINNKDPNETDSFTPTGGTMTLLPGQTASVAATLKVGSNVTPGAWTAYGEVTDGSGTTQSKPGVPITICGPLTVSKEITLDKKTVYPGQTINGQITYKNSCAAPYDVNAMKISARDPKASVDDFTPTTKAATISAEAEITVKASRTMSANDPLGTWKAFGSYENEAGNWVIDTTLLSFVLEATPSAKTASGSATTTCTVPSTLKNTVTVLFPTYTGGTVTVGSTYQSSLNTYATTLKSNSKVGVTINGYTDNTAFAAGSTGSITNNQQLSTARAQAVETYLKSKGATANKYTVKGNGVASGATSNDAAARKADVTASCTASGSATTNGNGNTTKTPATSGKTPANSAPVTTCTSNCGQSSNCTYLGGTCENNGTHKTGGEYVSGICPGPSTWVCWVPINATTCANTGEQYCSSTQTCYPVSSTCPAGPGTCASLGGACKTVNSSNPPANSSIISNATDCVKQNQVCIRQ